MKLVITVEDMGEEGVKNVLRDIKTLVEDFASQTRLRRNVKVKEEEVK
jgi:hypothetical protein